MHHHNRCLGGDRFILYRLKELPVIGGCHQETVVKIRNKLDNRYAPVMGGVYC